jgi:RNA polymerase sigma-70 factor (ECF subfamily)
MTERAFARAAEDYAARLYTVAFRLLRNRADAQDAVQHALAKCYAARASYSPRWAVSTWLYRALTNVCLDELRRRRTAARRVGTSNGGAPRGGGGSPGERLDLERALARVPNEARVLIALRYADGLSYRELARVRGISINTVKSQLARGKLILRRALKARGGDDSERHDRPR